VVVGEIAEGTDLLIIGGGPGGYAAAIRAAQLGREVVLVDRDGANGLGGTCVRVGCIPSKALIDLADVRHRAIGHESAGLHVASISVDMGQFQRHKNAVVDGLSKGVGTLLKHYNVRVVAGVATLNKPNRAAVATPDGNARFFEFRDVIVATGSEPINLSVLPRDGNRVLNSTDVLALTELPASIAVVGGGYIGVELGTAMAKLGCHVTIVEALDRILPTMEPALGRVVERSMKRLGVDVLLGTEVLGLDEDDGVIVRRAGVEQRINVEKVVVAVGRRPNSNEIGIEKAGGRLQENGLVVVDDRFIAAAHVAAIGDLVSGPALAHKATAEAEVAVEALSGKAGMGRPSIVPLVVFADPEVASAGLSEQEAQELGVEVALAQFPLSASGRAATLGEQSGFVRLVVDKPNDTIIGVHMVGPLVSELAGYAAFAIEMGASPEDFAGTIHPHPTISESMHEAALLSVGRPLHVMGK